MGTDLYLIYDENQQTFTTGVSGNPPEDWLLEPGKTGTFQWNILTNALDGDENLDRLFGLPPGETLRTPANFIDRVQPADRGPSGRPVRLRLNLVRRGISDQG